VANPYTPAIVRKDKTARKRLVEAAKDIFEKLDLAARVLGIKGCTMTTYAVRYGIGNQPGGAGTPWIFTLDDLQRIRELVYNNPKRGMCQRILES